MRRLTCLIALLVTVLVPTLASAHEGHVRAAKPVEIRVTEEGFVPSRVETPAGRPMTIVFRRTTDRTCATEAVFPSLKRRVALPLNKPVRITLRPRSGHPIEFVCGMGMYSGRVV